MTLSLFAFPPGRLPHCETHVQVPLVFVAYLLFHPISQRLQAVVQPLGHVIHPVWRVNGLLPPHLKDYLRNNQGGANEKRPPPAGEERHEKQREQEEETPDSSAIDITSHSNQSPLGRHTVISRHAHPVGTQEPITEEGQSMQQEALVVVNHGTLLKTQIEV